MNRLLYITALLLTLCSCGTNVVNEYCNHQCYYQMDFHTGHTTSYLYSAVTSTGYFYMVSANDKTMAPEGPYDLVTEGYGTDKHHETVTEATLTRPRRLLGLNNGIIVGRSSFQDGALYVFDRQCPNCYNANRRTRYPVKFKNAQNVYCPECKRTYGLLNGGVVVDGDGGVKLFRYYATYVGTLLAVSNPR